MSDDRSYIEHVAIRVRDIHWHIRFFREVLGMTTREVDGPENDPRQFWTVGGIQLIADPNHEGPEGRLAHLGIMVEDLENALARAAPFGVRELPPGRNWIALPDGLELELIQAAPGSVGQVLAVDPRAGMA
jgi:catechol 2,3-dioxygenase-like lactoylglutathione lyase family enzyme